MQNKWIKLGKDKRRITGCSLREVYDVFFGDPLIAQSASSRLLQHVLQRASPLLIGIGGAKITKKWKEFTKESRFASTYVVSLISILLYKLGSRKETYMKEAAFNVGRMLSLADLLHKEYCRHLRKSSPPAQMIGNALMATALDNPERGLARLSERLPIYKAWADKVEGEEGKWAKWALGQMGQISVELDKQEIPVYTNDLIKAHILLGYLARYEKKESE